MTRAFILFAESFLQLFYGSAFSQSCCAVLAGADFTSNGEYLIRRHHRRRQ